MLPLGVIINQNVGGAVILGYWPAVSSAQTYFPRSLLAIEFLHFCMRITNKTKERDKELRALGRQGGGVGFRQYSDNVEYI